MSSNLLVSPVAIGRSRSEQRLLDRMVPPLLRAAVATSRAVLGGRGVGLGCTTAAALISTGGQVSFRLGGGGAFRVRTDDRYWLPYLLLDQSYETDLDHFLARALTSRDSFLDCGANLGLWSIAVAGVIKDPARVVAVEAGSRTYAQLERNWNANDRSFTIMHRAVGDVSGEEVSFFASVGDHASATLVQSLSPGDAQQETVTTISLRDLIREQAGRQTADDALTFVKLDIEGMERQVFSTLDPGQHGNLVILYEDHGSQTDHVTSFVVERGFRAAFLADDGTLEPIGAANLDRLDALKTNAARGYNLLAFARSGPAAARMAALFPRDLG